MRRFLELWLLFQIPTVFVVVFAASVSPSGGIGWPLGLGGPALVLLTLAAGVAWALERRRGAGLAVAVEPLSGDPPREPPIPTPPAPPRRARRWVWGWVVVPFVLAQAVLIPLALFAAEFTLGAPRGGLGGGLAGYGFGVGVYVVLVALPLALVGYRRQRAKRG